MRLDEPIVEPKPEEPKLRAPRKAELVADNGAFIKLAQDFLETFRHPDDKSCAICGAPQGVQHVLRRPCGKLVMWRHITQYKAADCD